MQPGEGENLHPSKESGKKASFDEFKKFIHLEEIDKNTSEKFIQFLEELYNTSSNIWQPSLCYCTETLEKKAKSLLKQNDFSQIKVEPKSYCGFAHFWLVATFPNCPEELIIDPFGIPPIGASEIDYTKHSEIILPFFGNKKYAEKRAQFVYKEGAKLSRGYHVFHP